MGCMESKLFLSADELNSSKTKNHDNHHQPAPDDNISVNSSDINRDDSHFSQEQKTLLRHSWKLIDGGENHGIAIFVLIFHRKPSAKNLFPFGDVSDEQLLTNPMFRAHSIRFMHAIRTIIDSLDILDLALIPVLHRLGKTHVMVPGFQDEYLPVFIQAILDVMVKELGDECTDEVKQAWQHLGKFLSDKLIEGYEKFSGEGGENVVIISCLE